MRILIIGSKGNTTGITSGTHSSEGIAESLRIKKKDVVFYDPAYLRYVLNEEEYALHYLYKEPISIDWFLRYNAIIHIDLIFIDQNPFFFNNDVDIPVFYYHKYLHRQPTVFFPDVIFYSNNDMLIYHQKQAFPNYFYYIRKNKKEILHFAVDEKTYKPTKKKYNNVIGIGFRRNFDSWIKAGGLSGAPTIYMLEKEVNKFKKLDFEYFDTPINDKKYRELLSKAKAVWFPIPLYQFLTRRLLEAMACKTLCIIKLQDEYHRSVLSKFGFENGIHYISIDKLSKIKQAFDETTNKEEIIENAYKLVLEKHTYKNRTDQILDIYEKHFRDLVAIPNKYIAIDLGCGKAKTEGAIGVDIVKLDGVDVVYDLNDIPYPFKGKTVDLIIMNDILEHLDKPIDVMRECYRLLKKGGKLKIRVVYWNHKYSYSDPQHKHAFSEIYFDFFIGKRRPYYIDFCFDDLKIDYIFDQRAIDYFGDNLMKKKEIYFYCNIIQGLNIELIK